MAKTEKKAKEAKVKETKVKETKAPKKTKAKKVVSDKTKSVEVKFTPRLHEKYQKEIVPKLKETFSYKNIMQVPKLEKIVVNMGVGAAALDSKVLDEAVKNLESITGQKASIQKAKKSISNFKLREGMKIGAKVTLRKYMMYEFLDRLISVALPRVRDFRGISDKSFDGRGNFTMGIREQIIFPEIDIDKVNKVLGMDISFVTTANTDKEAYELLGALGIPFRKKEIN